MRVDHNSGLSTRPVILGAASAHLAADQAAAVAARAAFSRAVMEPGMALGPAIAVRENLSQRAYLRIRSSLIHSELRPGQRLVLRPLAAELRLSPTPVREALLRLVSEQALALDERGTAIVPVIGLEEFREIIEIRCDLEGRAAARAALQATAAEIEHIAHLAQAFHDAVGKDDRAAVLGSNADLHRMVCRVARAPLILRILEGIWMRIGPVYVLRSQDPEPPEGGDGVHPHDRLLAALRDRDGEAAHDAMVMDVRRSSESLERSLIAAG